MQSLKADLLAPGLHPLATDPSLSGRESLPVSLQLTGAPRFLCDVMVEGLARQLRLCGFDAGDIPLGRASLGGLVQAAGAAGSRVTQV